MQPEPEPFQWWQKYDSLRFFFSRESRRYLWTSVGVTKSFFTFNKVVFPGVSTFCITVGNSGVTRNKSNYFYTWKLLACLRGALKFPLSPLFYRIHLYYSFKEHSPVISVPVTVPSPRNQMSSTLSTSLLKSGASDWPNLDINKWQAECMIFFVLCPYHIRHSICQDQNDFSWQCDLWWLKLLT